MIFIAYLYMYSTYIPDNSDTETRIIERFPQNQL